MISLHTLWDCVASVFVDGAVVADVVESSLGAVVVVVVVVSSSSVDGTACVSTVILA
jgi:hypothetical protein